MEKSTNASRHSNPSIFVFAGDQSGDNHAAPIVAELKRRNEDLEIWGVGGPELKKAGVQLLYDCQEFAGIGFQHVVGNIAFFRKLVLQMVSLIKQRKPALLFLVDCGGINLRIARALRESMPELTIYQFISPQVWASRPWRTKTIKENVSEMLVIFPFEQKLLQEKGIKSSFVGHPLMWNLSREGSIATKNVFCESVGLDPQKPIVGIFPGSRKQEIAHIFPALLKAASVLSKSDRDMQFAVSVANDMLQPAIESCLTKAKTNLIYGQNLILLPSSRNRVLMSYCDVGWAKSGTTTLELGLLGKPMLICYRGALLDYWLVSLFKTTKLVGLPNILAGYELVPELLQGECNPGLIARTTRHVLDNPSVYQTMSSSLLVLANELSARDYVCECVEKIQASLVKIIEGRRSN